MSPYRFVAVVPEPSRKCSPRWIAIYKAPGRVIHETLQHRLCDTSREDAEAYARTLNPKWSTQ